MVGGSAKSDDDEAGCSLRLFDVVVVEVLGLVSIFSCAIEDMMEDDVTKYGNTYEDEQESNVETIIRCQKTDCEDLPKD